MTLQFKKFKSCFSFTQERKFIGGAMQLSEYIAAILVGKLSAYQKLIEAEWGIYTPVTNHHWFR